MIALSNLIAKEKSGVGPLRKETRMKSEQIDKANGNTNTTDPSVKSVVTNKENHTEENTVLHSFDDQSNFRLCAFNNSSLLRLEPSRNLMFRHAHMRRNKHSVNCVNGNDLPSPKFRASMKVALNSLFDTNKRCTVPHKVSKIGTVTDMSTDVSYSECATADVKVNAILQNSQSTEVGQYSGTEEFLCKTRDENGRDNKENNHTFGSNLQRDCDPQNPPVSHFYYDGLKVGLFHTSCRNSIFCV
jgi:hypothetical protein